MIGVLAKLAAPGNAFAVAFLVSLAVSILAGNGFGLVAAAFTLLQVVVVAMVVALFLLVVGLIARGLTQ